MKKMLVAICLLCIMITAVYAQLSWPEPLELSNFGNLSLNPTSLRAADGTQILAFSRTENGATQSYLQAFNTQNQALWDEPLSLGMYGNAAKYCLTSQGEIVIFSLYEYLGSYGYYMNRFNLQGEQIGTPDTKYYPQTLSEIFIAPDNDGGIHLIAKHNQDLAYQYITPSGTMLYPDNNGADIDALFPEMNYNLFVKQAVATSDGNLLISYSRNYRETLLCFDKNLQLQFRIQGTETEANMRRFSMQSDGEFYVVWTSYEGIKIQLCNSQGEFLWGNPRVLAPYNTIYQFVTDDLDRLLFCWWSGDDFKAQCIDQEGTALWQDGGVLIFNGPYNYNDFFFYSDGGQGYYVIRMNENGCNISKTVSYLNSDGSSKPWQVSLIAEEWYSWEPYHLAHVENGTLKVYYYCQVGESALIAYNEIDANGKSMHPAPGMTIYASDYGLIKGTTLCPLGPNRALVLWMRTNPGYNNWYKLQYNVVDPAGELVFEEPIDLTSVRMQLDNLTAYPTEDGNVLVLWRINNYYYAQKIDIYGQLEWAEAKQILNYPLFNDVRFSYYNNSLYSVATDNMDGAIYLQRFIDGEPTWSGIGKPVAIPNPDYQGTELSIGCFENSYLIWGQTYTGDYCEMYFVKKLGPDGEALEPYGETGIAVGAVPSEYQGLILYQASIAGNQVWLELLLAKWVLTGGHSSQEWVLRTSPLLQSIDSQGNLIYPGCGTENVSRYVGRLAVDGAYYRASRGYSNYLGIQKLDGDGNSIWTVLPLSGLTWYVYDDPTNLAELSLSKDFSVILLGKTRSGTLYHLTYCLIEQSGHVISPLDRFIYSSSSADYDYNLVSTRMGTYFVINSKAGDYAGIQFLESGEEPIPIPDPEPGLISLNKAYPNPFGGSLKLEVELGAPGYARLEIYNIRGQRVLKREYQDLESGKNELLWDGRDDTSRECASGIYFVRITDGKHSDTIKALRIK